MRRRSALLAAGFAALLLPALAPGHVEPRPSFVAAGAPATITLVLPNERAGHATIGLDVELPRGLEALEAGSDQGWEGTSSGSTARWRGSPVGGRESIGLTLRLVAEVEPTSVTFRATQVYEDGETVVWQVPLTVVPGDEPAAAPRSARSLGPREALAIAVVILLVGGSAAIVAIGRRRTH